MTTGVDITQKLRAWSAGDRSALDDLLPFLLANMRAIARRISKRGLTLETTALMNEAWLRLEGAGLHPSDREHFLALLARLMRHIVIDHARTRRRLKRGGGASAVTRHEYEELTEQRIDLLFAINDLLDRLEKEYPRRCRIFEMRFFGGYSVAELAEALSLSENTIIRDHRLACAWLRFHFEPRPMAREAAR